MPAVVPLDVEGVPVGKATVVPVGGANEEQHHASGRDLRSPDDEILTGDVPPDVGCRRLKAEDLLDGARDQGAVLHQPSPLVRMVCQYLCGPSDEASGRLVPGACE